MEKQNLFILPKKIYRNEQLANCKKKHEGQEFLTYKYRNDERGGLSLEYFQGHQSASL